MPERLNLAGRMVQAARELQDGVDAQATMEAAVRLAVVNVHGCDAAGITLVERDGALETPAYTDPIVLEGDLLQYELREGPCLDAVWDERVVHSGDLTVETRWPTWAPRVASEYGVRSMLCVQLFARSETVGALNLYSRERSAFAAEDRDDGVALAAHIAVAIVTSRKADQLATALDTRTVIGQACGILMERFDLDSAAAFNTLARLSAESNVKVRDIAHEIVIKRRLLDDVEN